MRWANERGLPIHRLPGGQQGSVFAYEAELAAWALQSAVPAREDRASNASTGNGVAEAKGGASRSVALVRRRTAAVVGGLIVALAFIFWLAPQSFITRASVAQLPPNAAVAADYVAARDLWGRRTAPEIAKAIELFEKVIARDPTFAPAYAGIAEAWLVYREYGSVDDARAFPTAKAAASRAIALDSRLASAHRASGFIGYWWDNDADAAVASFERSLKLNESDAQTHFWFANVLADLGDDGRAQRAYDRARLLAPGTPAIEVEQACAHWQAGRDDLARSSLQQLMTRFPADATIRNCLAWVAISRGDIGEYLHHFEAAAAIRKEPNMLKLAAALKKAVLENPATAHRVLIADARRELAFGARRIRETPGFYASAMGDRDALVILLTEAGDLGERWHSATIIDRIGRRWNKDATVMSLLDRVVPVRTATTR